MKDPILNKNFEVSFIICRSSEILFSLSGGSGILFGVLRRGATVGWSDPFLFKCCVGKIWQFLWGHMLRRFWLIVGV